MIFKNISDEDTELLISFYRNCGYHLCEYSAGVKTMWRGYFNSMYAVSDGCLIIKESEGKNVCFNFPVPSSDGDVSSALDSIDRYCAENGVKPVFLPVSEESALLLAKRYTCVSLSRPRLWRDYLYLTENFISFAGRRFSGQRNHINKFKKLYPDAVFRELTDTDGELLEQFWSEYEKLFSKTSKIALRELESAKHITDLRRYYRSGCMTLGGKIIGIALGEKCGDMMIVHIEKALYTYEGVYPAMVQAFAQTFGADALYSNREDDAGDKGLRTSKLRYRPERLMPKYTVRVGTEADVLDAVPSLSSDRLTLDAIEYADAEAYSAVCLDDNLNKYWGYDYRKDLKGELTENYFVDVAKADFKKRLVVNFAVRLDGRFIGEAVIYNFDFKGAAEIGCRIARGYEGHGYGAEAFAAAADWALYGLGLEKAVAKCFKENTPSFKMLSSCMTKCGEDGTFYYFEKRV